MSRLRSPDGCPWDREQTHESLRPYLIEEAYETLEAIDLGDPAALREELGDLLLQIVFHAQLAEETGAFSLTEVINGISDKMVRRHPHVFGDESASSADEVRDRWEQIKQAEGKTVFGGLPRSLPALLRAYRVGEKAANRGFDWRSVPPVFEKVREELAELAAELSDETARGQRRRTEELGDVLFAVANLARHLEIQPEDALRASTSRFEQRFQRVLDSASRQGVDLQELDDDALDALWERVKREMKHGDDPTV